MRHGCTLRWSVTAEPRESDPLQSAKQIRSLPPTGDCAGCLRSEPRWFV